MPRLLVSRLPLTILLAVVAYALVPSPVQLLAQKTGTQERTLKSGGTEREYLLHLPRKYSSQQKKLMPMVIMLHGRTSNGRAAASAYYGWRALADKQGFVAVFPTALGSPTSWKGAWRGRPTADSVFLAKLIDELVKELKVDKDRVFMTGHSSGGFMSYSFAATHAEKVAAIGPVAGLRLSKAKPKLPVSVISFHGMADQVVAYDNKQGRKAKYKGMPSAIESAEFIAKANGCGKVKRKTIAKGKVHIDTWAKGKRETDVVLYSIEDGDHSWPRRRSHGVGATQLIWEFFKQHSRSEKQAKK